jgi:hypothetical protein
MTRRMNLNERNDVDDIKSFQTVSRAATMKILLGLVRVLVTFGLVSGQMGLIGGRIDKVVRNFELPACVGTNRKLFVPRRRIWCHWLASLLRRISSRPRTDIC